MEEEYEGGHVKNLRCTIVQPSCEIPDDVGNPINRCSTIVVPAEEVERFEAMHVSLFALAKHFLGGKK
ncbi:hypothetical protein OZ411_33715 [Bradyrhizobium sp. Arg237L]|uniref:hypothetical protein n=1 Tax=Bradyrhizobium sp. Arg237L TaxID=3003352 RepID=UPI00249ED41B|nr:hypothetical protein [Bradyrhizobium sp. Arg237L]MDI4237773.1 hypothetical protein [Bradyrhizobium sp. Arg237L]